MMESQHSVFQQVKEMDQPLKSDDRDTLIRVEQQLKDSVQSMGQVMRDLKEIFQRIEQESKTVTTIKGDLKGHLESSEIRWKNLDGKLSAIDKRLDDVVAKSTKNENAINKEKDERLEFEGGVKGFKESILSSARTTKWIVGIMAAMATVISAVVLVLQFKAG